MPSLKPISRLYLVLFFSFSLLLFFQNCSQSFQVSQKVGSTSLSSNSLPSPLLSLTSNQAVNTTATEPCDPQAGWVCMSKPIIPKNTLIGAWYHLYFYNKGGTAPDHWADWTRYQPDLGYYDSGDIIAQQYPNMKKAGIDYLLLDNTNGWHNDGGLIAKNAKKVFANLPPDIAIAVAGGFPLWNSASTAAERPARMSEEADLLWNELAQKPNYLKWFDTTTNSYKPLFVVYNDIQNNHPNDEIKRYWKDSRFTIRYSAGDTSSTNPLLFPYAAEGLWGWAIHYPQVVSQETMAVQPGHNTTHLPNRTAPPVYRENGLSYMRQWLYAIKHSPRNIIIPSWNDWGEETHIEPGRRVVDTAEAVVDYYGEETTDWYLQITIGYSNLRKGLMPGGFYRTENDPKVYKVENGKLILQKELPHRKPVVMLPNDSLNPYITAEPVQPPVQPPANTPISEGLFVINNIHIYYSNGGAYCYFPNMSFFTLKTGRTNIDGIRRLTSLPSIMHNDGNCQ